MKRNHFPFAIFLGLTTKMEEQTGPLRTREARE